MDAMIRKIIFHHPKREFLTVAFIEKTPLDREEIKGKPMATNG